MVSALFHWFGSKVNKLSAARQQIQWQEALDCAVEQIADLEDINSEKGQAELRKILGTLREVEIACKGEFEIVEDSENTGSPIGSTQHQSVLCVLPWGEHMSAEHA